MSYSRREGGAAVPSSGGQTKRMSRHRPAQRRGVGPTIMSAPARSPATTRRRIYDESGQAVHTHLHRRRQSSNPGYLQHGIGRSGGYYSVHLALGATATATWLACSFARQPTVVDRPYVIGHLPPSHLPLPRKQPARTSVPHD